MVVLEVVVGEVGAETGRAETALDEEVAESLHVAVTMNVYSVPFSKPLTVQDAAEPVHEETPATFGLDVTEYDVIV